jgi:hypothetical protein
MDYTESINVPNRGMLGFRNVKKEGQKGEQYDIPNES